MAEDKNIKQQYLDLDEAYRPKGQEKLFGVFSQSFYCRKFNMCAIPRLSSPSKTEILTDKKGLSFYKK